MRKYLTLFMVLGMMVFWAVDSHAGKHTRLFDAVKSGDLDGVKKTLKSDIRLDFADFTRGWQALHYAAEGDNEKIVKYLIKKGADINAKTRTDGMTALHIAAFDGHQDMIDTLLKLKADLDAKDAYGMSAMHYAARGGNKEAVQRMIAKGAPIDGLDKKGWSPLMEACKWHASSEFITWMLDKGAELKARGEGGMTPLMIAADERLPQLVDVFLKYGADLNAADKQGTTAFHYACSRQDNIAVVEILIAAGAAIDSKDKNGQTPLINAVRGNAFETVKLLIEKGANIQENSSMGGETLLQVALVSGSDIEIAKYLLSKGASATETSGYGEPVLFQAIYSGDVELVKLMLNAGANVHAMNLSKQEPLFAAVMYGNIDIVKALVEHGADLQSQDVSGNTPVFYAGYGNDPKFLKELLELGVKLDFRNYQGELPIHYFAQGTFEMLKNLPINKDQLNAVSYSGMTPLEWAISGYRVANAKYLIEKGADVSVGNSLQQAVSYSNVELMRLVLETAAKNSVTFTNEYDLVGAALERGDAGIIKLLADHGFNFNTKDLNGNTPAFNIRYGKKRYLEMLHQFGVRFDIRNKYGELPIHHIARYGTPDLLKDPVITVDMVNAQSDNGKTPLDCAIAGGNALTVDILFQLGADVKKGNPVEEAVKTGNINILKMLVEKGADISRVGEGGCTPIFFANDLKTAEFLVEKGANLNAADKRGTTLLMYMVQYNLEPMVSYLLSKGADPKKACSAGVTPLHFAVIKGDVALVKLLISNNVDFDAKINKSCTILNIPFKQGSTALELAREYRMTQIEEILIAAGAKEKT